MNSEDSADVNFAKQAAETTSKAELQLIKPDLSSQKGLPYENAPIQKRFISI